MAEYIFDDSLEAEQYNTLLLLDNQCSMQFKDLHIDLYILGGTALLFHGIESVVTIDIDVANQLNASVKEVLEPFVSDAASEVATLASGYKERLVPYKPNDFQCLRIYLLSLEDLVISKLGAFRFKDKEDLTKTSILDSCDLRKCMDIITAEFPVEVASKLLRRLTELMC